MDIFIVIILLLASLVIGVFFGYYLRKALRVKRLTSAEKKAEELITTARNKEKDLLLTAKDKALAIIEQAKREEGQRRREIAHLQERVEKRETLFDKKLIEFETRQRELYEKVEKVEKVKEEIKKIREEQFQKLEKIAQLSQEEAKNVLLENVEKKITEELVQRINKLEKEASEEIEKRAKELLTNVIERCASSHAAETTTTVVTLPSDEMKGRIIGREGRNIKTIEQLTGVEIVVDDTPEAILISGFSPIRRQLAKIALEKLIADGRIHPGRIEEVIEASKRELALDIKKAGEEACYEIGITGLDPKLIMILGRLKYRTSYGQNQLKHALEVAHLSGLLAAELGANVVVAKKGGLLHDVGKAVDHEVAGGHPEIGYDILKKFNLPEEVSYIAKGHHEDHPQTLEALIVKVADAISGARPGARKDTYENYLQRLTELETLAMNFSGVEKCYAIQAGREIRVFVKPTEIDDLTAVKLARDIADKIEQELKYPGEIKVNVIREMRVEQYAR